MTTTLIKLRGFAAAARSDSLIATAEADILDRLVRVAEDEEDDRLDGALEELADNLRRVLDRIADRDDDDLPDDSGDADTDLPSTGCPTCDAVLDTLAECHGMSLCGPTAADVAESARDWIGDLIVERDEARENAAVFSRDCVEAVNHMAPIFGALSSAEDGARRLVNWYRRTCRERDEARADVERLRAEVASLRSCAAIAPGADASRAASDLLADSLALGPAPDTADLDDDWEPGPWWECVDGWGFQCFEVRMALDYLCARVIENNGAWGGYVWVEGHRAADNQTEQPTMRAAMRWCEQQPEMDPVRAAYTSAPTVGATDAGPDVPALIVEGDAAEGAPLEGAVPAAPVSTAEQRDGETGVDRPRVDSREPDEADR